MCLWPGMDLNDGMLLAWQRAKREMPRVCRVGCRLGNGGKNKVGPQRRPSLQLSLLFSSSSRPAHTPFCPIPFSVKQNKSRGSEDRDRN